MIDESKENNQPKISHYDVARLIEYAGPSFRQTGTISDGIDLLDYRNTDENEGHISALLSALGIPFKIERPRYGWTGTRVRLVLTVPKSRYKEVEALLTAAAKASLVNVVEGNEGLYSR